MHGKEGGERAFKRSAGRGRTLGTTLNTLGKVLNENGRTEEAQRVYERALDVQIEARGETHPSVATALNNLGTVLAARGDLEGSLVMFERALDIRRVFLPAQHRQIATATANVAETLSRLEQHERALGFRRESADVFAAVEGEESRIHAVLRTLVAYDLRMLDRLDGARASVNVALENLRHHPLEDEDRFAAEAELALIDAAQGNTPRAVAFFESALERPLRSQDESRARELLEQLRK